MLSTNKKSPVKLVRFNNLEFFPRFEYGDAAQISEVAGVQDGTELGVGWVRLTNAQIPWTIQYDEVLTVFKGKLKLKFENKTFELNEGDSIWLPAQTKLIYESDFAIVHYSIHPANWSSES